MHVGHALQGCARTGFLTICAVQEWADGISLSCKFSTVTNNTVTGATDGGIVIFGSPGSHIYNNTVKANNVSLLPSLRGNLS